MNDVNVLIGSGAIGLAIARRIGAGRTIVVADISRANAETAAASLSDSGFTVRPATVDVTSRDSVEALARLAAGIGPVGSVIHAAGVSPSSAPPGVVFKVDLYGTAVVLDVFGIIIARRGVGLVVSSQAGHRLDALSADDNMRLATTPADELLDLDILRVDDSLLAYQIAKRGASLRVAAAAPRWAERGARVNAISPGFVVTALSRRELEGPNRASYERMLRYSAGGRPGTPDEIATLGAFLMGSEAGFISGSDFLIDGGVTAAHRFGGLEL